MNASQPSATPTPTKRMPSRSRSPGTSLSCEPNACGFRSREFFVLVDLYTDGTDAPSEQNQQLEEKCFGTVAIPFNAIVDPDERTLATFPGLTRKATEFVSFLSSAKGGTRAARL